MVKCCLCLCLTGRDDRVLFVSGDKVLFVSVCDKQKSILKPSLCLFVTGEHS